MSEEVDLSEMTSNGNGRNSKQNATRPAFFPSFQLGRYLQTIEKPVAENGTVSPISIGAYSCITPPPVPHFDALKKENDRLNEELKNLMEKDRRLVDRLVNSEIELDSLRGASLADKAKLELLTKAFDMNVTELDTLKLQFNYSKAELETVNANYDELLKKRGVDVHWSVKYAFQKSRCGELKKEIDNAKKQRLPLDDYQILQKKYKDAKLRGEKFLKKEDAMRSEFEKKEAELKKELSYYKTLYDNMQKLLSPPMPPM